MRIRKALISLAVLPILWTATAAQAAVTPTQWGHSRHHPCSSANGIIVKGNGFLQLDTLNNSTPDTSVTGPPQAWTFVAGSGAWVNVAYADPNGPHGHYFACH